MRLIIYFFYSSILFGYSSGFLQSNNFRSLSLFELDTLNGNKSLDKYTVLNLGVSSYINSIANINLLSVDFRNKSEFLEFSFMPVIVNDKFNQILYGTNYSRLGFYGRVEKSFLKVHLKNSSLKIGRGDNADNLYPHISILDTGFYPSSDEITFKLKENNYIYELCIGELSNEKDIEGRLIKRNFGKHSLNILFNEKTSLEFGEMIIYTGVNRNFELVYMNPFIPFFLTV